MSQKFVPASNYDASGGGWQTQRTAGRRNGKLFSNIKSRQTPTTPTAPAQTFVAASKKINSVVGAGANTGAAKGKGPVSLKQIFRFLLCLVLGTIVLASLAGHEDHIHHEGHFEHVRMAVVFPFIFTELEKLKTCLTTHWVTDLYATDPALARFDACTGHHASQMDLILAFNKDHTDPEVAPMLQSFLAEAKSVMGHCFKDIRYASFGLTEDEDGHPSGVSFQMFRMIIDPHKYFGKDSDYQYMQVMETDVYPVKPNWLDAVYRQILVDESFWIKGSYFQGTAWDEHMNNEDWVKQELNFWGYHINGAALYNLQDPNFKKFVQQTLHNFPPNVGWAPYDITLAKQRMLNCCLHPPTVAEGLVLPADPIDCLRFRQKFDGKFRYSLYLQMRGTSIFDEETQKDIKASRITVLVHGALPTASASLKQIAKNRNEKQHINEHGLVLAERGSQLPMKVFDLKQDQWLNDTDVGLAFWHVPKSAGTQMHVVLTFFFRFRFTYLTSEKSFENDLLEKPDQICKDKPCEDLPSDNPRYTPHRIALGAFEWMLSQHMYKYEIKNFLFVCAFREPVDLRKSLYTYRLYPPESEGDDQRSTLNMTMKDFIADTTDLAMTNFACRGIANLGQDVVPAPLMHDKTLEMALGNLDRVFVLLTSDLAESVILLHSFLGTKQCFHETILNARGNSQKAEKKAKYVFTKEDEQVLAEANQCDLALYEKIKERYELQKQRIKMKTLTRPPPVCV